MIVVRRIWLFREYPYLLPCLIVTVFQCTTFVLCLFLMKEPGGVKRERGVSKGGKRRGYKEVEMTALGGKPGGAGEGEGDESDGDSDAERLDRAVSSPCIDLLVDACVVPPLSWRRLPP
jgi:hypothetical protein